MTAVRDIMHRDVPTVTASTLIIEVARKMKNAHLDFVAVCENGKFRGIITSDTLVRTIASDTPDFKGMKAMSLVTNGIPKVSRGTDLIEAVQLMARHGADSIPVVQNGRLLGILALEDVLRESPTLAVILMTKRTEAKHREPRQYVAAV